MTGEALHLVHEHRTFEDQTVYLTGNVYIDCHFTHCVLVVRDRWVPQMSNCKVKACLWHLDILVQDYREWQEFLAGLAPKITASLPHAPGDKGPGDKG